MKVLVMIKSDGVDEAAAKPNDEMFAVMNAYNEQLVNAGIMLGGEGLKPSSEGAKVVFATSGETSVVDGPFTEAKEIVAGYWIWQVSSLDEATEWAKRCPSTPGIRSVLEIRPFFEMADFEQVLSPETIAKEQDLIARAEAQQNA
ncbi:YciI family protein [Cellulomonas sp. McL0617]|uniref:YciI family protein n=1 Tax=Cellulomonas sp. McL0617 TaxID=3415675 RepID=UPI003CEE909A